MGELQNMKHRSSRDRERHREKDKSRDRVSSRIDRDREIHRSEKESERDKIERVEKEERAGRRDERERDRKREERVRDREREKVREKRREAERDEEEDHERKRRRRERSHEKERECNDEADVKEKKYREQDLEEEQRKLDEEMDKRRRRVQEWQELKRKKEEREGEKDGKVNGEESNQTGMNWTLDGESDNEEADGVKHDGDVMMGVNYENKGVVSNGVEAIDVEDDIDPLDAFMNSMVLPEVEELESVESADFSQERNKEGISDGVKAKKGVKNPLGRITPDDEDSASEDGDIGNEDVPSEDEDDENFMKRVKKTKTEKLSIVDHSKIQYPSFRKNFYIEVKEIGKMTPDEVAAYRKQLELKVHGKDIPKPIKTWNQTGLASKILDMIKKLNFEKPMPIQAQALPIIMSGRDCIGIAKTGSGKTLAFVLPMLRHIKDQPPVVPGDGPIALIIAPTRELVQQIHSDIKKFSKVLGFNCVPVYGGSRVAQQISELKRGAEIVVCTPDRMIDILYTSAGKITNLRKVTYLVMDEADRMFDMGFEPQITRIVQNTRPDRQTVLFSATFPPQVEILAKKVLFKPVEI